MRIIIQSLIYMLMLFAPACIYAQSNGGGYGDDGQGDPGSSTNGGFNDGDQKSPDIGGNVDYGDDDQKNPGITIAAIGDANADGKINVGDITAIAGYILGSAPSGFVEKYADANGDSKVNVGDITTIAGMILDGTANKVKAKMVPTDNSVELAMTDVNADSDEIIIPVCVNNTNKAFSSFQFDVNVPEGFMIKNVVANSSRVSVDCLNTAAINDGTYRILGYNLHNDTVRETAGAIVYLTLAVNKNLMNGSHEMTIDNVVFAKGSNTMEIAGANMRINVSDATGILNLASRSSQVKVYDINGRLVRNSEKSSKATEGLAKGVYIVDGAKIIK